MTDMHLEHLFVFDHIEPSMHVDVDVDVDVQE